MALRVARRLHLGRPPLWWSGLEAETHRFAHPAPYRERHVLVGVEHGEVVCATDVVLPLRENQHTASVGLAVRPDARGAYVDELLILHRQMEQDVPRGELSREPLDLDLERLRTSQQRLADTGWTPVTSLVLVGGEAAGYTEVLVHRDDEVMVQEDTLVLPAHRGRRLGQLLKTANLQRLEPVREGRTLLQTFTADSNTAMRATNTKFGFEPADVLYECEGDVSL